jgi:hypothetical protein
MTLLEQTYRQLRDIGLVATGEAFSTRYLGRNKNWYAWQRHAGRDFGVLSLAHCIRALLQLTQQPGIDAEQLAALQALVDALKHKLANDFGLAALLGQNVMEVVNLNISAYSPIPSAT